MNIKRIALSTLVIWVFSSVWGMLTCGWLFTWVYQIPPTTIWKTPVQMMQTGNMAGMYAVGLLLALAFVLVYAILYKGLPYKGVKKGITYGLLAYLLSMGFITMPFYSIVAWQVVIYWIANFLASSIIMGALVGWVYKK